MIGTASNRDAVGARVRLTTGGHTQIRDVRTSSGYLSQSDPRLHFGLGPHAVVDRIEISWPSGTVQNLRKIAADHGWRGNLWYPKEGKEDQAVLISPAPWAEET